MKDKERLSISRKEANAVLLDSQHLQRLQADQRFGMNRSDLVALKIPFLSAGSEDAGEDDDRSRGQRLTEQQVCEEQGKRWHQRTKWRFAIGFYRNAWDQGQNREITRDQLPLTALLVPPDV